MMARVSETRAPANTRGLSHLERSVVSKRIIFSGYRIDRFKFMGNTEISIRFIDDGEVRAVPLPMQRHTSIILMVVALPIDEVERIDVGSGLNLFSLIGSVPRILVIV